MASGRTRFRADFLVLSASSERPRCGWRRSCWDPELGGFDIEVDVLPAQAERLPAAQPEAELDRYGDGKRRVLSVVEQQPSLIRAEASSLRPPVSPGTVDQAGDVADHVALLLGPTQRTGQRATGEALGVGGVPRLGQSPHHPRDVGRGEVDQALTADVRLDPAPHRSRVGDDGRLAHRARDGLGDPPVEEAADGPAAIGKWDPVGHLLPGRPRHLPGLGGGLAADLQRTCGEATRHIDRPRRRARVGEPSGEP